MYAHRHVKTPKKKTNSILRDLYRIINTYLQYQGIIYLEML